MQSITGLALHWLLTDVAITGAPKPRIEIVESPRRDEASVWLHGTSGTGFEEHPSWPPHEQIADIAEVFQEWVIEESWGRGSNWPPCRLHPTTHPMEIVAEVEAVHWVCPFTREELAELGHLYGGSWYANAPEGGGRDWDTGGSPLVSVRSESGWRAKPLRTWPWQWQRQEPEAADPPPFPWLKIMPEHGLTIPLWDDDGPIDEQGLPAKSLGLSAPLLARLVEVQEAWERLVAQIADDRDDGKGTEQAEAFDLVDEEELAGRLALRDLSLEVLNELAQELGPDWRIHMRL